MSARRRFVVRVDFGTLSGRAVVVAVDDGEKLGSAVHEYSHGAIDAELRRPESACRRTGPCRIPTTTDLAASCATTPPWMNRKPRYFRADWGGRKIKLIGADVCKLLWFYRPDSAAAAHQRDVVKRLVEECAALSLPLVVEPIWYPLENEDPATAAWRERRAEGIVASGIEASQLGIDMLKTEFPGYTDDDRGREQAVEACAALDAGIAVPWVLLSAGVGFDEFTLQCVSGWFRLVLCGSAGDLVVGRRAVQRAEPEEGLEGGHWGAAAVVTEDVPVEVDG